MLHQTTMRDEAFARLLTGPDEVTYNLFSLISESAEALAWTDGATCLIAQSNERTPLWLYLKEPAVGALAEDISAVVAQRLTANPRLFVNAHPEWGEEIMARAAEKLGLSIQTRKPLIAYQCRAVIPVETRGEMASPTEADIPAMARLRREMAVDAGGDEMPPDVAEAFARDQVGSDRLFLWKDAGMTVSMAKIAHQGPRYARINTVVTQREARCRGYAGMLVSAVAKRVLDAGLTPMLYADADYPASNRAYRKIGFEETGRVTTFAAFAIGGNA